MLGHEAFAPAAPGKHTGESAQGFERIDHAGLRLRTAPWVAADARRRYRPRLHPARAPHPLGALPRRGAGPRASRRQDAEHAGHAAAIIAGDLLLAAAIKLALRAAESLPQAAAIENSFHLGIHHAGAGELEDLLFSLEAFPAKVQEVLRMEELKTAAYSFQVPLHTGALLAGAEPPGQAAALADIGSQLGVAYQLIDDVLGTFGDPAQTGKSIESDLREGKSTILTAMAAATPGFNENLQRFREQGTDVDVAAMRDALRIDRRRTLCPAIGRGTVRRRHHPPHAHWACLPMYPPGSRASPD